MVGVILGQLLANAVKYTESGTVTVTVTKDKVLKVSDTGIGIAPEDLPRIFERSEERRVGKECIALW